MAFKKSKQVEEAFTYLFNKQKTGAKANLFHTLLSGSLSYFSYSLDLWLLRLQGPGVSAKLVSSARFQQSFRTALLSLRCRILIQIQK